MAEIPQPLIDYTARSFPELRSELDSFARVYFPDTYQDFTAEEAGGMMIDMMAFVGDMVSFYTDKQLTESRLMTAQDVPSLLLIAQEKGYRPRITSAAVVDLTVMQQLPPKLVSGSYVPDMSFAVRIPQLTSVRSSSTGIEFVIENDVDFSVSSYDDPMSIVAYNDPLSPKTPTWYLATKKVKAFSGTLRSKVVSVGAAEAFRQIVIDDERIIGVVSCKDSAGNEWLEVPVLGEDSVWATKATTTDATLLGDARLTPRLLYRKDAPRRFTSRFLSTNELMLEFGGGTAPADADPTTTPWQSSAALTSPKYGEAPRNTTLTIQYIIGGGSSANIASYALNAIDQTKVVLGASALRTQVIESVTCYNEEPARGGGDGDTVETIRLGALNAANKPKRGVSTDDYERLLKQLPAKLGSLRSVYAETEPADPATIYIYLLSQDENGFPAPANAALRQNISTYLNEYRLANHRVVLRTAEILPIKLTLNIKLRKNKPDASLISSIIQLISNYFKKTPTQIGEGLDLGVIERLVEAMPEVDTVHQIDVTLNGTSILYDLAAARVGNIVHPSLDPSLFTINNPSSDIGIRVV